MKLATADVEYGDRLSAPPALGACARILEEIEQQLSVAEEPRPILPPFDVMNGLAGRAVASRWSRPCEAAFELLARRHPLDLARLIEKGRLASPDLTFAAEALGRIDASWIVRQTLLPLLEHADAIVREGAVYGLQKHLGDEVRERLTRCARTDVSAGVRAAAEDALSDQ